MLEKKHAFLLALTVFCGLNQNANAQSAPAGSITISAPSGQNSGSINAGSINLGNPNGTSILGAPHTSGFSTQTLPSGFGSLTITGNLTGHFVTTPSGVPPINVSSSGGNLVISPIISGPGITAPVVSTPVSIAPISAPTSVPSSTSTQSTSPTFSNPNFDKLGFGTVAPSDLIRYAVRINAKKKNKAPTLPLVSLSALLKNPRPTIEVDKP